MAVPAEHRILNAGVLKIFPDDRASTVGLGFSSGHMVFPARPNEKALLNPADKRASMSGPE
jgi:hypothetical protein